MKKIAVVYASVHHRNTEKLLLGIKESLNIDLIPVNKVKESDVSKYDVVGFASGIYMGKFHKSLLNCIDAGYQFPKDTFVICTSGIKNGKYLLNMQKLLQSKGLKVLGGYQCKGYDTYGFLKLIGGIAKGHPTREEMEDATVFVRNLLNGR